VIVDDESGEVLALDAPAGKRAPKPAPPLHWPSLEGEALEQAQGDLAAWVAQLVDRFSLEVRQVPPCWLEHNPHVEALQALRDYERGCYGKPADPTAAVDWLRALRDVTELLTEWASHSGCTVTQHRDGHTRAVRSA
jgi:hypothetical protein